MIRSLSPAALGALVSATLFSLLCIPGRAESQTCTTIVPGGLVVQKTWTAAGSPYCVTGDLQVSLLTVEPGVTVLVDGPFGIEVLSTITAEGTSANPIVFSSKDSSARWKGFRFTDAPAGSALVHVVIERSESSAITLVDSHSPRLGDLTIRDNTTNGVGGGMRVVRGKSDLTIVNCDFSNNTAAKGGGALYVKLRRGFKLTLDKCTFEENVANPTYASGNFAGGALYLRAGAAEITRSSFIGNESRSRCSGVFGCGVTARGGAIYTRTKQSVFLGNNLISGNKTDARNQGDCFFGGSSGSLGAGLFVAKGPVQVENNILACNQATSTNCGPSRRGGGIFVAGGSVEVVNSTIARNPAAPGLSLAGGTLDVVNSIVFFNNSDTVQVDGTPTIAYSDVQGAPTYPGLGNLTINPVFAAPGCTEAALTVVAGSPAIDAGNPAVDFDDQCLPPSLGTVMNDMGAHGGPLGCRW